MTIVETTVWVDYLNHKSTPETEWPDRNIDTTRIGLFDLILCEVLQGFRDEREFRQTQAELLAFEVLETGGAVLAIAAAQRYGELRRRGITVRKTVDCLIATACILGEHKLLHNHRDYEPFERHFDLAVIHP